MAFVVIPLLLFAVRWDLAIRSFALCLSVFSETALFEDALQKGYKQRFKILAGIAPSIFLDLLFLACITIETWVAADPSMRANPLIAFGVIGLIVVTLVGTLPFCAVTQLNETYVAGLAANGLSLTGELDRYCKIIFHSFGWMFAVLMLQSLVINLLVVPPEMLSFLREVSKLFEGGMREVVTGAIITAECCIMTPLMALLFAISSCLSALTYDQLTMRFEATDILKKLTRNHI